jgi:hypothetical protein
MRPDGEAPLLIADEVRMILRHSAVVHHLLAARVAHRLDGPPLPVVRPQRIAPPQLPRRRPAPTPHPERMLRRRPQHPLHDFGRRQVERPVAEATVCGWDRRAVSAALTAHMVVTDQWQQQPEQFCNVLGFLSQSGYRLA